MNRQDQPARPEARERNEQLASNLRRAFPVDAFPVDGSGSFAGLLRAIDERTR